MNRNQQLSAVSKGETYQPNKEKKSSKKKRSICNHHKLTMDEDGCSDTSMLLGVHRPPPPVH
jgi:hypothetical protein